MLKCVLAQILGKSVDWQFIENSLVGYWFGNADCKDYFILSFRSYSPILSDIKQEFEMALKSQTSLITDNQSLKSSAAIVRVEAARQMQQVRRELAQKIESLEYLLAY